MRYFVDFYENVDVELIESYGGIIKYNYINIPSLCSIDIDDGNIELLKTESIVKYVEKVGSMSGQGFRDWGWGQNAIKTEYYYNNGYTGKNVKVAILDTGIATHNNLPSAYQWKDFVNNRPSQYDDNDHGTFIAGIIAGQPAYYGNAPDVKLYIGKILDSGNRGYGDNFVAGIDWAIGQNVDIINFSIAMDDDDDTIVINACRRAYNAGIIVVGISGNGILNDFSGVSSVRTPGKDYSTVCVGSVNENLQRSSFSNYGTGLDLVAPGEDITSTGYNYGTYIIWNGTSFAAPFVVSHFACLKEKYPTYSRSQLVDKLYANIQDLNNSWEFGRGLLKAELPPPPAPPTNLRTEVNGLHITIRYTTTNNTTHVEIERMYSATTFACEANSSYRYEFDSTNYDTQEHWRIRAKCNDGDWGNWSSYQYYTTGSKPPKLSPPPSYSHYVREKNAITVVFGAVTNANRYGIARLKGNDLIETVYDLTNPWCKFTDLSLSDIYKFKCYAYDINQEYNSSDWSSFSSDILPGFGWTNQIAKGVNFKEKMPNTDWNNFIDCIKKTYNWKGRTIPKTLNDISSGGNLTASMFNDANYCVNNLNATNIGTKTKYVSGTPRDSDIVKASDFNTLVEKLNGI